MLREKNLTYVNLLEVEEYNQSRREPMDYIAALFWVLILKRWEMRKSLASLLRTRNRLDNNDNIHKDR